MYYARTFRTVVVCLSFLAGAVAVADDALSNEELVRLLGSSYFLERQHSESALIRRGSIVRDAVMNGLDSSDLEVRMRCEAILSLIRIGDEQARIDAFLKDVEDKQDHGLPGWKKYRELYGADLGIRKQFIDLYRYDLDAFVALEKSAAAVQSLVQSRINEINRLGYNQSLPDEKVMIMLTLGASTKSSQVYSILSRSDVKRTIREGKRSEELLVMLRLWLERADQSAYGVMRTAMDYQLGDAALKIARKTVKAGSSPSNMGYSMLALGRHGGKEDLELLKPLLKDKKECHAWFRNNGRTSILICDVALAASLHLLGEDPKNYGYDALVRHPDQLFQVYSCCFDSDEAREKAFKKYEALKPTGDEG